MARSTRKIGLSLGADICWPGAYEGIVRDLKLEAPLGADVIDFAVERVTETLRSTPGEGTTVTVEVATALTSGS